MIPGTTPRERLTIYLSAQAVGLLSVLVLVESLFSADPFTVLLRPAWHGENPAGPVAAVAKASTRLAVVGAIALPASLLVVIPRVFRDWTDSRRHAVLYLVGVGGSTVVALAAVLSIFVGTVAGAVVGARTRPALVEAALTPAAMVGVPAASAVVVWSLPGFPGGDRRAARNLSFAAGTLSLIAVALVGPAGLRTGDFAGNLFVSISAERAAVALSVVLLPAGFAWIACSNPVLDRGIDACPGGHVASALGVGVVATGLAVVASGYVLDEFALAHMIAMALLGGGLAATITRSLQPFEGGEDHGGLPGRLATLAVLAVGAACLALVVVVVLYPRGPGAPPWVPTWRAVEAATATTRAFVLVCTVPALGLMTARTGGAFESGDAIGPGGPVIKAVVAVVAAGLLISSVAGLGLAGGLVHHEQLEPAGGSFAFEYEPVNATHGEVTITRRDGDAILRRQLFVRGSGFARIDGANQTRPGVWRGSVHRSLGEAFVSPGESLDGPDSVTVGVESTCEIRVVYAHSDGPGETTLDSFDCPGNGS